MNRKSDATGAQREAAQERFVVASDCVLVGETLPGGRQQLDQQPRQAGAVRRRAGYGGIRRDTAGYGWRDTVRYGEIHQDTAKESSRLGLAFAAGLWASSQLNVKSQGAEASVGTFRVLCHAYGAADRSTGPAPDLALFLDSTFRDLPRLDLMLSSRTSLRTSAVQWQCATRASGRQWTCVRLLSER